MNPIRLRDLQQTLETLRAAEHALFVGASEVERSMAYARVVEERATYERRVNDAYASKNEKLKEAAAKRRHLMAERKKLKMEHLMARANAGSISNAP